VNNPCPYPEKPGSSFHCWHDARIRSTWRFGCAEWWHLFYEQDGRCAVCGKPWEGTPGIVTKGVHHLHTDHRHSDGLVRGLLCGPCNRGLGDDWERKVPEVVAYVLNPLAARLELYKREKQWTSRERAKAKSAAKVSPYRAHLRAAVRPSVFACEAGCPYGGHGGVVRVPTRRPAVVAPPRGEPGAEVVIPLRVRIAAEVLRAGAVACGLALAAMIVWALLPVLVGAAVLTVTGLLAARSAVPG
jgi:hypothetical protein